VQAGLVGMGRHLLEGCSPPEKGKELGKVPDNGLRCSGKVSIGGEGMG
jgi:hypothetical protein